MKDYLAPIIALDWKSSSGLEYWALIKIVFPLAHQFKVEHLPGRQLNSLPHLQQWVHASIWSNAVRINQKGKILALWWRKMLRIFLRIQNLWYLKQNTESLVMEQIMWLQELEVPLRWLALILLHKMKRFSLSNQLDLLQRKVLLEFQAFSQL
jgi:hypothetical protein